MILILQSITSARSGSGGGGGGRMRAGRALQPPRPEPAEHTVCCCVAVYHCQEPVNDHTSLEQRHSLKDGVRNVPQTYACACVHTLADVTHVRANTLTSHMYVLIR